MLYKFKCEMCSIEFGRGYKTARFCSRECLNQWQRTISWEDRIGKEKADEIRHKTSLQSAGDKNPTKNPDIAKKVSIALKKYFQEYDVSGERNPFYGKHHTEEYKRKSSESKRGKWAYNEEQYKRLCERTPKGENHPLWRGGPATAPYTSDFNKALKERIKLAYANKCVICQEYNKKLFIHHIDYDKENSDDSNLVPLCNSCHTKTNYNRSSWIVFFKSFKKEKNSEQ